MSTPKLAGFQSSILIWSIGLHRIYQHRSVISSKSERLHCRARIPLGYNTCQPSPMPQFWSEPYPCLLLPKSYQAVGDHSGAFDYHPRLKSNYTFRKLNSSGDSNFHLASMLLVDIVPVCFKCWWEKWNSSIHCNFIPMPIFQTFQATIKFFA